MWVENSKRSRPQTASKWHLRLHPRLQSNFTPQSQWKRSRRLLCNEHFSAPGAGMQCELILGLNHRQIRYTQPDIANIDA